jgi:uncharacterized protein YkwD
MHRRASGFGTRQVFLYLAPFAALTVLGIFFGRSLIGSSDTVSSAAFSGASLTTPTTAAAEPEETYPPTAPAVVDASLQSLGVKKGKITLPGPAGTVKGGFVMFVVDGPERVVRSDTSAPYSIKLDTTKLRNGTYTVTVLWTHKNKSSVASTSTFKVLNPKKKPVVKPSTSAGSASGSSNASGGSGSKPPATSGSYPNQVLQITNAERKKAGCKALSSNSELTSAAQAHSSDMARNHFFDHDSRNGDGPFDRVKAAGYSFSAAAENIAMGQQTPSAVMKAWMNSPGHKANIVNCTYTQLGVGYAVEDGTPYWTQDFGKPL